MRRILCWIIITTSGVLTGVCFIDAFLATSDNKVGGAALLALIFAAITARAACACEGA